MNEIPKQAKEKLEKLCKDYKVPSDLIDFFALYDRKLTESENLEILTDIIKGLSNTENQAEVEGTKKAISNDKEIARVIEKEQLEKEEEFTNEELNKAVNNIKFTSTNELDKAFKIIKQLTTTLVKSKDINGLILQGGAGLGKSFNIIKCLKDKGLEKGKDYEMLGSYTTPLEFYKFLYDNRENKILILDDTIGFFNNKINIGLVLASLWGEGKRMVRYNSSTKILKDIPKGFLFNSKIIWCCNNLPNQIEAVMSRCYFYKLEFNYGERIKLLYEIAKINKINLEVVDYIKENTDESFKNLDFRLLFKINDIHKTNKDEWRDVADKILGLQRNEKLSLLKQFLKENSTIKEAQEKWCEETGNHRATFYRLKQEIIK